MPMLRYLVNPKYFRNVVGCGHKVVAVVFLYKAKLPHFERINLLMAEYYLNDILIVTFQPDGASIENPFKSAKKFLVRRSYFRDLKSYNSILLSLRFYKLFKGVTNQILIIQPDVTLVNRLDSRLLVTNQSMIGARWEDEISIMPIVGRKLRLLHRLMPYFAVHTDNPNGGLSLRNVKTFINLLKFNFHSWIWLDAEDVFFSRAIALRPFKQHDSKKIDSFSLEAYSRELISIPAYAFGFHALHKNNPILLELIQSEFLQIHPNV